MSNGIENACIYYRRTSPSGFEECTEIRCPAERKFGCIYEKECQQEFPEGLTCELKAIVELERT